MAEKENNKSYFAIIPADVRYDKELPMGARLLYGEFTALSNQKGYCYASNNYFAGLYDVTPQAISKWIKLLGKKNYIKLEYIYNGKETKERRIYIQVSIPTKKEELKKEDVSIDIDRVSTSIDRVSTGIDRGINIGLKRIINNNNTLNNTSSGRNSSTDRQAKTTDCEEETDLLDTKNKTSEQSDITNRPEEKETYKDSDSQNLPDGLAPWETPAKKSKPKVPLPVYADVEAIVLKNGTEWKPDVTFFQEMERLYPTVDIKAEFMAMRGWCISNPTKRKTLTGIKRFVSGWLDRAKNKTWNKSGKSSSGVKRWQEKHKEAFVDGQRDYSDSNW